MHKSYTQLVRLFNATFMLEKHVSLNDLLSGEMSSQPFWGTVRDSAVANQPHWAQTTTDVVWAPSSLP
jgi:hypothetical protein